ncbi:MAG: hypothetical protein P8H03_11265 [Emcibacteraceae bacterium]|nr:hypothetical protein [Emcibacteraceae bacterium]MDG1858795.1 hypothetical protein [Emcibacteraceae bacterium]
MTKNIERVSKVSKRMQGFCTVLMWLIPLFIIYVWLDYQGARDLGIAHKFPTIVGEPLLGSLIVGFIISALMSSLIVGGIYHLRSFFELSKDGNIFSNDGVGAFYKFSKYIVIFSFITMPVNTLMSVIMSWGNPVGQREITLSFQAYDLALIFLSLVLFTVSLVMKESVLIAEENAQII